MTERGGGGVGEPVRGRGPRLPLLSWLVVLLVVGAAAVAIRDFVYAPFVVSGTSMAPTLHDGDRVLVDRTSSPRRGDIVVVDSPLEAGRDLIKRVVATGGEHVEIHGCAVTVDGTLLAAVESLDPASCPDLHQSLLVPTDSFYVMGDNRSGSTDSRVFGPIAADTVVGVAVAVIWPVDRWRGL